MKTITQYELHVGWNNVWLPYEAQLLDFQMQKDGFVTWALTIENGAPLVERRLVVEPTDGIVPDDATYIGTVQNRVGYSYHLFEVP